MTQYFAVHPTNPQPRLVRQAAQLLCNGAVVVYPTDSCYALGCLPDAHDALLRIRRLREMDDRHPLTYLCPDLTTAGRYARMDNRQFRLVRTHLAGGFTFILRAGDEVPRHARDRRRHTIGIRIPGHPVAAALLEAVGGPLLSTTLMLPGDQAPLEDPQSIRERLGKQVDLIVDGGLCNRGPTTIIDLTGEQPQLVRRGCGDPAPFGLAV